MGVITPPLESWGSKFQILFLPRKSSYTPLPVHNLPYASFVLKIVCPPHHSSDTSSALRITYHLCYTSFFLLIICLIIICRKPYQSFKSIILIIICSTYFISYSWFVLHIICITHHQSWNQFVDIICPTKGGKYLSWTLHFLFLISLKL